MARLALAGVLALCLVAGAVAQSESVRSRIGRDTQKRFTLWSAIIDKATQAGSPDTVTRVPFSSNSFSDRWTFGNAAGDKTAPFPAGVPAGTPVANIYPRPDQPQAGTYLVPTDEGVLSTLEAVGLSVEQILMSATACDRLLKYHQSTTPRNYADLVDRNRVNNPDILSVLSNQPTGYTTITLFGGSVRTPAAAAGTPVLPGPPAAPANPTFIIDVIRQGTNSPPKFQGFTYNGREITDVNVVATLVRPSSTVSDFYTNIAAGCLPNAATGLYATDAAGPLAPVAAPRPCTSNNLFAVHVIDSMLLPPVPAGTPNSPAPPIGPAARVAGDYFFSFYEALAFTPGTLKTMQLFRLKAPALNLDVPNQQNFGLTAFVPTDAAWAKFFQATNIEEASLTTGGILAPGQRLLRQLAEAHFLVDGFGAAAAVPAPPNVPAQTQAGLSNGIRYSAEWRDGCYATPPAFPDCQLPLLKTDLQLYPVQPTTATGAFTTTPPFSPVIEVVRQVTPGSTSFQLVAENSTSTLIRSYSNIYSGYPRFPDTGAAGAPIQQQPPNVVHLIDQVIFPDLTYRMASALEMIAAQAEPSGANVYSILMKALQATGMDLLLDNIQNATIFLPTDAAFTRFLASPFAARFPWANNLNGFLADTTALNKILAYHIIPWNALDWRNSNARRNDFPLRNFSDPFAALRPPLGGAGATLPYPTLLAGSTLRLRLAALPPIPAALADQNVNPIIFDDFTPQRPGPAIVTQRHLPMLPGLNLGTANGAAGPTVWPTWYAFNGMYQLNTVLVPDFEDAFSVIAADPDLQMFEEAIAAAGMEATFSALRRVQVYAPTNLAFEKYLTKIGKSFDQVKADRLNLINLVTYHIANQYSTPIPVIGTAGLQTFTMPRNTGDGVGVALNPNNFQSTTIIPTSLAGASISVSRSSQVVTAPGGGTTTQTVISLKGNAAKPLDSVATFVVDAGAPFVPGTLRPVVGGVSYCQAGTGGAGQPACVVVADNGILNIAPPEERLSHFQIFKVDGVLIPDVNTASITDVLATLPDTTIFVQAYIAAGFQNMLDNLSGVTVFAPNNNAFQQLLANLRISLADLLSNRNLLVQVISNHIVVGSSTATNDASFSISALAARFNTALTLSTMWDPPASSYSDNTRNVLRVGSLNPPTIVSSSVPNSRGVVRIQDLRAGTSFIHVVDSVLLPK